MSGELMDMLVRRTAGRSVTITAPQPEVSQTMNRLIREAAGRGRAEPSALEPEAPADDDNHFARLVKHLGCIDSKLARVAYELEGHENLSGAALRSAVVAMAEKRPSLFPNLAERREVPQYGESFGGYRGGRPEPEPPSMNDMIFGAVRQQRAERDSWAYDSQSERQARERGGPHPNGV